ncbi:MAG: serine hydrolase domain-containing protein [Acidimicrobiales bacterium]
MRGSLEEVAGDDTVPGLDPGRLGAVGDLLEAAVGTRGIPGAVVAVGLGPGEPAYRWTGGWAEGGSGRAGREMTPGTVFDLASLTKVMATLPCVLALVEGGAVELDDPVVRFLPDFSGPGKDGVSVRHLLSHTSGLPDHREYYRTCPTPEAVMKAALAEPLVERPGAAMCYSDVGFMVLAEVVRAVTGLGIDAAARDLVFSRLGMEGAGYLPAAGDRATIAATEAVGGEPPKVGVVHDENAEALGGVAGHAGLFAPVEDVVTYVRAWVDPASPLLEPATRAEALRCQTPGLEARRGLGWTLRGDRWDHTDGAWPATAAGHTGFTGTSVALDPASGAWVVMLTNAVHYGRDKTAIVALRRRVHAAVGEALRP